MAQSAVGCTAMGQWYQSQRKIADLNLDLSQHYLFEDYGITYFAACLWILKDSGLRRTLKDILNHLDTNREKWNLDPYYVLHTKIISIWIIDQCVKEETTKISKNTRAVSSRSWNRENTLTWRKIQWMGVYWNE